MAVKVLENLSGAEQPAMKPVSIRSSLTHHHITQGTNYDHRWGFYEIDLVWAVAAKRIRNFRFPRGRKSRLVKSFNSKLLLANCLTKLL